jgi:hypothetical protein
VIAKRQSKEPGYDGDNDAMKKDAFELPGFS